MLWALRRRRADRGETTPALVQGFLLACGLAGLEAAQALAQALDRAGHRLSVPGPRTAALH